MHEGIALDLNQLGDNFRPEDWYWDTDLPGLRAHRPIGIGFAVGVPGRKPGQELSIPDFRVFAFGVDGKTDRPYADVVTLAQAAILLHRLDFGYIQPEPANAQAIRRHRQKLERK